jgi:DNA invertase Pin-like site-specific DNA recombinase
MMQSANEKGIRNLISKKRDWFVAFYMRLSREDIREGNDESESIKNQRLILTDFLEKLQGEEGDEFIFVDEYVDEGVSGTTDEYREDFQHMLKDIVKGKINCVIVKNLARSFRNVSDQNYYLDDFFPKKGVRFISLYQHPVDTYKDTSGSQIFAAGIQGLLNEAYAKSTSESVRETFNIKREKGLHIGSFAAFGYQKDPQKKNLLIVDYEAAEVVKNIYSWFLEGISKNKIVHRLNDSGILCPSLYKQSKGLKYSNPHVRNKKTLWSAVTVTHILKNQLYVGDMVQGRFRKKSYKINIQELVPEDDWFIVENTHTPIISREDFKKVQNLLKKNTRTSPMQKELYLFSGLLLCGDCGKSMIRSEVKGKTYYYCSTYKSQSKLACTKHSIKHYQLEQAVLYTIKQLIYIAAPLPEMISEIQKAESKSSQSELLIKRISFKEEKIFRLNKYKQSLYQDWKDKNITYDDYILMRGDYEKQINEANKKITNLKENKVELDKIANIEDPMFTTLCTSGNIDKLTRELLLEFVEEIKIYEENKISVNFKFYRPY